MNEKMVNWCGICGVSTTNLNLCDTCDRLTSIPPAVTSLEHELKKIPYVFNVSITESMLYGKELWDIRVSFWFCYKGAKSDVAHHLIECWSIEEIQDTSPILIQTVARKIMAAYWNWATKWINALDVEKK